MNFVHPAYSPDAAIRDFFLFGHVKCEMAGFVTSLSEDKVPEIHQMP
jgi:hypothetical protein